jgi:hypothetical protein
MPDYEKFAIKTMDIAHNRGIDVGDPDAVEPIAKEVAKEYVVDEEELITIVRQRAKEYIDVGNMDEDPPENDESPSERSDEYPEADTAAEFLLEKASEYDIPEEEREDVDWSKYNTDEHLKNHDITAPDIEPRWYVRYESSFKQAAVNDIERTESIEIDNELDFINSLRVNGDETVIKSLMEESFIIDIKQYEDKD